MDLTSEKNQFKNHSWQQLVSSYMPGAVLHA